MIEMLSKLEMPYEEKYGLAKTFYNKDEDLFRKQAVIFWIIH